MTRDQIQNIIKKILIETYKDHTVRNSEGILAHSASEKIMNLWDKGFVYNLKTNR